MALLIKPYKIAVYEDALVDGNYVEQRLGIIGSDTMTSQNRAFEPNFVRNVNGQKTLSFK